MNNNLLADLINDLWSDISKPAIAKQLLVVVLCLAVGWLLARTWRRFILDPQPNTGNSAAQVPEMSFLMQSFVGLVGPCLMLVFLLIAKSIMIKYQAVNVLRLAIPLVGSVVLIRAVFFVLRRVFARAGAVGRSFLLFEKSFATLVWCIAALYITGSWVEFVEFFDTTSIPLGKHRVSLSAIVQALTSIVLMVLLALWLGAELESRLMKVESVHLSLRVVATRAIKAVLLLIGVLLSLAMVGIDLTVLSVFGGALGVGIGLGLQKIASNYVSGFVILLERSLKIGDMINVDKYYGRVTQINTRYTVLQGLDGIESVIPNEMLVSGVVQNFSLSDTNLRLAIQITVSYKTDVEKLIPQIEAVVLGIERVVDDPAPQAVVLRFGDNGVELEVGFWISDPENGRGGVKSQVNLAIWRLLQAENVELPYPQREIRILAERPNA